MDKGNIKSFVVKYLFLFVIILFSGYIFYLYSSFKPYENKVNIANPLNLEINYVNIMDNKMFITIYNPNNYTVSFIINIIGMRNGFGSTAAISHGGDIGMIITIRKKGYRDISVPIYFFDVKNVISQWRRSGGNLTISIYYSELDTNVNGVVTTKVSI